MSEFVSGEKLTPRDSKQLAIIDELTHTILAPLLNQEDSETNIRPNTSQPYDTILLVDRATRLVGLALLCRMKQFTEALDLPTDVTKRFPRIRFINPVAFNSVHTASGQPNPQFEHSLQRAFVKEKHLPQYRYFMDYGIPNPFKRVMDGHFEEYQEVSWKYMLESRDPAEPKFLLSLFGEALNYPANILIIDTCMHSGNTIFIIIQKLRRLFPELKLTILTISPPDRDLSFPPDIIEAVKKGFIQFKYILPPEQATCTPFGMDSLVTKLIPNPTNPFISSLNPDPNAREKGRQARKRLLQLLRDNPPTT